MPERFTEVKALITTYDEQRQAAERKKKEAEIVLSYLRAALSDLRELEENGNANVKMTTKPRSQPQPEEAPDEFEDRVETASVPSGNEKASISALLGGSNQEANERMD